MRACHILFCFIFLHLQDGHIGLANTETSIHEGVEGGNVSLECQFVILGRKMSFCKETCENGNVLIETTDYTAQRGRYSIKYVKNYLSKDIVHVSITQLKKSDSGWYRCTLDTRLDPCDFKIVVTEASNTSPPDFTPHPFSISTFLLSASTTATATQPLNFTSGSSTPSSGSDVLLYVILILVVMITILSAALLIFCKKKRAIKRKGPPVETEYANITQAKQLCEEIREGVRPNSSLPVEVSSIYTTPKCLHQDGVENIDLYSLVTIPQNKAKDDINEVDYAEVDFSHISAANSAPCGKADDVYSTPLIHARPASYTNDASPLYSAVKKQ